MTALFQTRKPQRRYNLPHENSRLAGNKLDENDSRNCSEARQMAIQFVLDAVWAQHTLAQLTKPISLPSLNALVAKHLNDDND
jgi:hypothetical protein